MHCSSTAKFFGFPSTIVTYFLVLVVLKIAIWFFSITNTNALFLLQMLYTYKRIILGPQFLYYNFFQNFDVVHNEGSSIILIWSHHFSSTIHSQLYQRCFTQILFTYFSLCKISTIYFIFISQPFPSYLSSFLQSTTSTSKEVILIENQIPREIMVSLSISAIFYILHSPFTR